MTDAPARRRGLRLYTPADRRAERAIEAWNARERRPGRAEVATAFKRAAPALGLDARRLWAIDQLLAFTMPIDWTGGPITVWPSNRTLARAFGLGVRAAQNLLAALKEDGLIAFLDSPSGKRWGRRDEAGRIVEAYGVDLRPLAQRYEEFLDLAERDRAEEREKTRLRRKRVALRKTVARLCEAGRSASGRDAPWLSIEKAMAEALADDLEQRAALERSVARLETLRERAREAFDAATTSEGQASEGAAANDVDAPVEKAPLGEAQVTPSPTPRHLSCFDTKQPGRDPMARLARRIEIESHLDHWAIEPALLGDLTTGVRAADWRRAGEAARASAARRGIGAALWGEACDALSERGTIAAAALIAARGEAIANPPGYLRAIAARARLGRPPSFGPELLSLAADQSPSRGISKLQARSKAKASPS